MKNQSDLVAEAKQFQDKYETRRLTPPGIEILHTKSIEDITQVLGNILKSQAGIVELKYEVGKYIELKYEKF